MASSFVFRLFGIATGFCCACGSTGRFIDVDPIYEPVQQVHQSFFREPSFAPAGKKIAVMDFKGDPGVGQVFADALSAELFRTGFRVAERQNVEILLKEMRMASSGAQDLSDTQILQKIGKMADVDVVIVGGVVTYQETVSQLQFDQSVQLPFSVWTARSTANPNTPFVPPGVTIYRWRPGSYKTPAGLPVNANIYASARGIEVSTGRIVWIDTVNVQTSGITQVTGLERLGKTMALNFAGKSDESLQLYIWNGEAFSYPENWEEVQRAWKQYQSQKATQ